MRRSYFHLEPPDSFDGYCAERYNSLIVVLLTSTKMLGYLTQEAAF